MYDTSKYSVTVRRINVALDKTNFRPVLRRVKASGEKNLVFDCSIETLPELLKQVRGSDLNREKHEITSDW